MPHEGLVRNLQSHIKQQEVLAKSVQPQVENFISNNNNCTQQSSYASVAAGNHAIIIDGDSDDESEGSFHTAPSSPMRIDQEPGEIEETDDLQKEYDETLRLMHETEEEIQRIHQKIKEKEDRREVLRLRMLRFEVRSSIKRNRQSTQSTPSLPIQDISSPPAKKVKAEPKSQPVKKPNKGKERVTGPVKEEDGEIVEGTEEGEIIEEKGLLSMTLDQIAQNAQQQQEQLQQQLEQQMQQQMQQQIKSQQQRMPTQLPERNKQQKQKRNQQLPPMEVQQQRQRVSEEVDKSNQSPTPIIYRSDAFNEYIKVMKSRLESNDPDSIPFPDISSLSANEIRKLVVQSHLLGNVNMLQMKIHLLDLKKQVQSAKLNRYQEAHVHCLIKRLLKNPHKPNSYIPTANQEKKNKKLYTPGPQPAKILVLGPDFYGNPKLRYDGFMSSNDDMVNRALFYFMNSTQKLKAVVPLNPGQAVPRIMFKVLENKPNIASAKELRAAIMSELQNVLENEVKPFLVSC